MLPKPLKHNLPITVFNFHQSAGFSGRFPLVKHLPVGLPQVAFKCIHSIVIIEHAAKLSGKCRRGLAFVKRPWWQRFAAFEMPVVQEQHPAGLVLYRANKHPVAPRVAGQVAWLVVKPYPIRNYLFRICQGIMQQNSRFFA